MTPSHPGGEANTLDSLGFIAHRTGDLRQAISYHHQCLAVNAYYRVNVFSGLRLMRHDDHSAGTSYRTYQDRALLNVEGDAWRDARWRPRRRAGHQRLLRALEPGEPRTPESLVPMYKAAPVVSWQVAVQVQYQKDDRREISEATGTSGL
ncbi:hypothetical protein GCM10017774_05230 [Lentzea cavernae]|uniref:Tetratricopeptide repeat-containing protein n=1 Tax=Lentzea cavernae TaxID=2020703 RepID=A0ABQ3LYM2_9PSEU|nr:hypothetical protein GCM10017774_05230 [Lentzea cavernae]